MGTKSGYYFRIFRPVKLGKLTAKNRIKFGSVVTNFTKRDGAVTDTELNWVEAVAKGGSGIVTVQGSPAETDSYLRVVGIYDDKFIPGLRKISDVIHENGALACMQFVCFAGAGLHHQIESAPLSRGAQIAEKIGIDRYTAGAVRSVKAGYDIIEISNVPAVFSSGYENDVGFLSNVGLVLRIIERVRAAVGDGITVGVRICGKDLDKEFLEFVKSAESAGIDYISIAASWEVPLMSVKDGEVELEPNLLVAERVKRNVKIPVSIESHLFMPDLFDKSVEEGKIDLWEMSRLIIADPALPNKMQKGAQREIIPCVACNLCLSRLSGAKPLMCAVRPTVGHEGEREWGYYGFEKARHRKRVLVIGGGVAGMQAASVAAQKGHKVTLAEKKGKLGGQLTKAICSRYRNKKLNSLLEHFTYMLKKNKVKILLRKKITPENIGAHDVVIIATGAVLALPEIIPYRDSGRMVKVQDVIDGRIKVGRRVIIFGDSDVAITAALQLSCDARAKVVVIEEPRRLVRNAVNLHSWYFNRMVKERKIEVVTATKIAKITARGVEILSPKGGKTLICADTIINATMKPRRELLDAARSIAPQVYSVGDAFYPRSLVNAIYDGYWAGLQIDMPQVDIPLDRKFERLAQITRATHFGWRETVASAFKDANLLELVKKYWEITARDTAKGYLRRLDPLKPLAPQVAEAMVADSVTMGEDAKFIPGGTDKEAFIRHDGCPWFDWHSRLQLLDEDQPGCDSWFFKTVEFINKQLGTDVKIETLKSLPNGDLCCLRRVWVE